MSLRTWPFLGASGVTRTPDLLITNQLLYRLSYTSIVYENWLSPYPVFQFTTFFPACKEVSLRTASDLLITNQLLYRLSYTSGRAGNGSSTVGQRPYDTTFFSPRQEAGPWTGRGNFPPGEKCRIYNDMLQRRKKG